MSVCKWGEGFRKDQRCHLEIRPLDVALHPTLQKEVGTVIHMVVYTLSFHP